MAARTKTHANGLATFGATEPILTILDVRGFELRDMLLLGLNEDCGSIVVATEERACAAKVALEPAYQVRVRTERGQWFAEYERRQPDGTVPSWMIRTITLKDGTIVMRDGRWIDGRAA
ncbi:hypothetical protein [Streptomyces sp. NPDC056387]|uniref:hypothetical protein n=1 Tax=Streptomyces sp. NPDC056387 TaxID=3345803 RepID=UPI0035D69B27